MTLWSSVRRQTRNDCARLMRYFWRLVRHAQRDRPTQGRRGEEKDVVKMRSIGVLVEEFRNVWPESTRYFIATGSMVWPRTVLRVDESLIQKKRNWNHVLCYATYVQYRVATISPWPVHLDLRALQVRSFESWLQCLPATGCRHSLVRGTCKTFKATKNVQSKHRQEALGLKTIDRDETTGEGRPDISERYRVRLARLLAMTQHRHPGRFYTSQRGESAEIIHSDARTRCALSMMSTDACFTVFPNKTYSISAAGRSATVTQHRLHEI